LVARRGQVHVEAIGTTETGGSEPMRRDTIFRIASVTKQIAAAAAMTLIEECRLRLDDPVDGLLPELADRKVLTRIDAPLDDTVPAQRPITVRDLLTFLMGTGLVVAPPGQFPIQRALDEAGLSPGPAVTQVEPDEWMKRLGSLPLAHQPGEKWMYHTGSDALGVLMARATGLPLPELLAERIFGPLGMPDTGFHVPAATLHRLAAAYQPDPQTGALVWGLGVHVFTRRTGLASVPGRFGWNGGAGTSVYNDPAEELIGVLLTQREMTSPVPPSVFGDFWTCAYRAIDG